VAEEKSTGLVRIIARLDDSSGLHQATGIVTERRGTTVEVAHAFLCCTADALGIRVTSLARAIVDDLERRRH